MFLPEIPQPSMTTTLLPSIRRRRARLRADGERDRDIEERERHDGDYADVQRHGRVVHRQARHLREDKSYHELERLHLAYLPLAHQTYDEEHEQGGDDRLYKNNKHTDIVCLSFVIMPPVTYGRT